jgi:hypothetical protein
MTVDHTRVLFMAPVTVGPVSTKRTCKLMRNPGHGCLNAISKSWKVGYNQVIGPPPRWGLITNYMGL